MYTTSLKSYFQTTYFATAISSLRDEVLIIIKFTTFKIDFGEIAFTTLNFPMALSSLRDEDWININFPTLYFDFGEVK